MDFRPVLFLIGIFLSVMALSMAIPLLTDLYAQNDDWKAFFVCMVITAFFGGSLILSNGGKDFSLNVRQIFFLTVSSWFVICTFAALPFSLSTIDMNTVDAFFEAVSGLTTTGASVIADVESVSPGILIWRSILQWLGGVAIIVMALSVMPFLKVGGMQLFQSASADSNKALPRAAKLATSLIMIYISLSLICAAFYIFAGMTPFDGFNHAMTTISTGGFSTKNASLGHYQSLPVEMVATFFMALSGLPFVLFLWVLRGNTKAIKRDTQVRVYLFTIAAAAILLALCLSMLNHVPAFKAAKDAVFTTISLMTGTGYYISDFSIWGGYANAILIFLMVIGGCAGSTTCGIKIFRFQILYEITQTQMRKLIFPSGVFTPQFNGQALSQETAISVMSFFFAFAVLYAMGVLALSFIGLDLLTSLSAISATLANVGPGLGPTIGPEGSFQELPESAKWILAIFMIIGRLEILPVLVIFSKHFWKY